MSLERRDWELVKKQSETALKEAELQNRLHSLILKEAEYQLKKFPEEKREKPIGV